MRHVESTIKGYEGVRIYTQRFEVENPKAGVVILHGYCEHSHRYGHVVEAFVQAGLNCYLLDHRGHGHSEGPRAHVMRFEDYLEDLDRFFEFIRGTGDLPRLFMLGHSMGGLIAASYALSRRPDLVGVVLSSPYLGIKIKVPAWKDAAAKLMSRVAPTISLKSAIDANLLTHDQTIVQEYMSDPGVSQLNNARWYTESNAAQQYCLDHAGQWPFPSLILHGGDDRIADPMATKAFAERIHHPDVRFQILEGMYHEIMNELDRQRVLDMMIDWILHHA